MEIKFELDDVLVDEIQAIGRSSVAEFARALLLREIGAARLRRDVAAFEQQRARDILAALGIDEKGK